MKKPIIGITLDYINDLDPAKYSDFPWYALRQHYSKVIIDYGGVPIFLPFESYNTNLDNILDIIDGLLIPGGDMDVPPSMYNEEILYDTIPCLERCKNEKLLIMESLNRNLPILAICHGMQLLNVSLGGTLYQNIKEQIPHSINHKQRIPKTNPHHKIKLASNSLLQKLVGEKSEFPVNSYHRQSVKDFGKNLVASAICVEDGVIEAIESTKHDFVIGIEWHPEIEASKEIDSAIFTNFVTAAINYQKSK